MKKAWMHIVPPLPGEREDVGIAKPLGVTVCVPWM
jgi:hypothetical protein